MKITKSIRYTLYRIDILIKEGIQLRNQFDDSNLLTANDISLAGSSYSSHRFRIQIHDPLCERVMAWHKKVLMTITELVCDDDIRALFIENMQSEDILQHRSVAKELMSIVFGKLHNIQSSIRAIMQSPLFYDTDTSTWWDNENSCSLPKGTKMDRFCEYMFQNADFGVYKKMSVVALEAFGDSDERVESVENAVDGVNKKALVDLGFPLFITSGGQVALLPSGLKPDKTSKYWYPPINSR